MKIGTITYWESQENYGQLLQCYALLHFLRQMGHDAFLIKYLSSSTKRPLIQRLKSHILYAVRPAYRQQAKMWKRLNKIEREEARKHPRHFDEFRRNHIPSTPYAFTAAQLRSTPPKADAYVCGSDQIWANLDPVFFLQFGSPHAKRIAFAPSFGSLHPSPKLEKRARSYLEKFDFLSSRERSGIELLCKLGYPEASLQPDPTLLLPATTYRKIEVKPKSDKPYLFLYLLGNETDVSVDDIHAFAHTHHLQVRYVASQGRIDEFPKLYPTVEEWLGLLDNAAYVITNSFHGTVFCLHFNRPFLTFPVKGSIKGMNNRITDLLERYNLRQRIYEGSLDDLFNRVDFQPFNRLREEEENRSKELFISILNKSQPTYN